MQPKKNRNKTYTDTVVSHTSDLGIDIGVADFEVDDVDDVLPRWINRSQLRPAADPADASGSSGEELLAIDGGTTDKAEAMSQEDGPLT